MTLPDPDWVRPPVIVGVPRVGRTLRVLPARLSRPPVQLNYQWARDGGKVGSVWEMGGKIDGADGVEYVVAGRDEGHAIYVTATAKYGDVAISAGPSMVLAMTSAVVFVDREPVDGRVLAVARVLYELYAEQQLAEHGATIQPFDPGCRHERLYGQARRVLAAVDAEGVGDAV